MADLLDELLAAVGIKNEELKRTSSTIAEAVGVQVQEQRIAEEKMLEAASKSREVKQAELLAEQKAANNTAKYAEELGTNPDASSYALATLAQDWRDSATDAAAKNKELSRATSSKFLDDPVQWIKDQIFLESKEADAKAANQRVAASQQALQFAQTQTQQAAVTQNALSKTRSDATIQATLESMEAEAAAAASRQRINNASINIEGISKIQALSLQQLNNLGTAFSAVMQDKSFKNAQANLNLQTKSLQLSIDERTERLENAKMDRKEMEDMAATALKGAAVLGYENAASLPPGKVLQMLKAKDPRVSDWLMAGMKSESIGYPVVSENPGEAARVIVTSGAPLRGEQDSIKKMFGSFWNEAVNTLQGAKPEQIQAAVGKAVIEASKAQMKNIKTGDATNIYAAPPLTVVTQLPAVKTSKLYTEVFASQMSTGALKEFNPDQMVSITLEGIKSGKINLNDASEGLQGMFNAAKSINNATKNYPGFGLPPQAGFNTSVNIGGLTRKYDLTQKQAIDQILNFNLAYKPGANNPFVNQRNQAAGYNALINPSGE